MSSINKLSIRGVRSFSPEDSEQVVEFYFPITIILGANGCGKTTIIESLKYAITGALPPGARPGQAFVHDPKVMGRNICKASVKLRLTSKSGEDMVVLRSMELWQRKTIATFKQLDALLRTLDPKTGEFISSSYKCSELDRRLPSQFGISRPIMEHVLFCHQEDASWPLQEGAVLKKRFDDIFDSTRYSRAVEVFRQTESDLMSTLNGLKEELLGYKSHQHTAQVYRRELGDLNDQVEALDEEKKQVQLQLSQCEIFLEECAGTMEQVDKVQAAIKNKKNQLAQFIDISDSKVEMLEDNITSKHSLAELRAMLSEFDDQQLELNETKLRDLEKQHQRLQRDLDVLRKIEVSLSGQLGKHTAEKEAHESRVLDRFTKMEALATAYNVDLPPSEMEPPQEPPESLEEPGASDTAQRASDTAQGASDTAQSATDAAQGSTDAAQGASDTAQGASDTAQGTTDAAQGTGDTAQDATQEASGTAQGASDAEAAGTLRQESVAAKAIITRANIQLFFSSLDTKLIELKEKVQQHRARAQEEEDRIQTILAELIGKRKASENDRARFATEAHEARNEISSLTRESIADPGASRTEIDEQKDLLASLVKDLDDANIDPRKTEIADEINNLQDKITGVNHQIDEARQVLELLRLSSDTQNAIALLEEQIGNDTEQLGESLKEQSQIIQKYNIPMPAPGFGEDLLTLYGEIKDAVEVKFEEALEKRAKATSEVNKMKQVIAEKKALLGSKQKALTILRSKMAALDGDGACVDKVRLTVEKIRKYATEDEDDNLTATDDDLLDLISYVDGKIAVLEKDDAEARQRNLRKITKKLKKLALPQDENERHRCPCCLRDMNDNELSVFVRQLQDLPQSLESIYAEDDATSKALKSTLKSWRSTLAKNMDGFRDYRRMSNEAPDLETDVSSLQEEMSTFQNQRKAFEGEVAEVKKDEDELRKLVDQAKRWYEDANRIIQKRSQVAQKRDDLSKSAVDNSRDLRTVEKEISDFVEQKDEYTNKINELNQEMSSLNSKMSRLSSEVSSMKEDIRRKDAKYDVEQKAISRTSELEANLVTLAEEERKCQEQIVPLKQKIKSTETERDVWREMSNEEGQVYVDALDTFKSDVKSLRDLVAEIDKYAESSKSKELDRVTGRIASLHERMDEKKEEIRKVALEVDEVRSAFKEQERHKKQLKENIAHLEGSQRIETVKRELVGLQEQLTAIEAHDTVHRDHAEAARRKEQLVAKKAELHGRWIVVVERVRYLKRKLSAAEYKKVDEQCRVVEIKHATTQMAIEDLKTYYGALDKALLQFHGKKMVEINKIIREIWMMTYKGEDIDSIEIVSGQEPGSRAQKSYNYRVVMNKAGAQMDMRGRCSAGQRVLASVVIRLALAEAFGVNCGCIALDEPTVNLDYLNKKSLAISLAQIVANRAQQSNFQLIMITHDEEFVGMMKTELSTLTGFSMPDKYFHVRRERALDGKYYSKIDAVDWDELA